MENAYDRRERTIYVAGMHETVTEEHLYDLFTKAGPIEKVILKENEDGAPQHALVIFKNIDSVMFAIAYLQGSHLVGDQAISIRPLRESSHHSALETAMARVINPDHHHPMSSSYSPPAYNLRSRSVPGFGGNVHVGFGAGGRGGGGGGGHRMLMNKTANKVRPLPGQIRGMASAHANKGAWGASLFSQIYGNAQENDVNEPMALFSGGGGHHSQHRDSFYNGYDPSPGGAPRNSMTRSGYMK